MASASGSRSAVDAFALEDLALTVQGQVVGVLRHQDMGQKPRSGPPALDGAARQGRLDEALAPRAREPRPHDPVHDEPSRHVLQFLSHVLAQASQPTTAACAGVLAGEDLDGHARDVVGERATPRALLVLGSILRQAQLAHDGRRCHLARLERQLELLGALARGPEPLRPVACKLMAQLLDQHRLSLHLGDQETRQHLQVPAVVRKGRGLVEHDRSWHSSIFL